MESPEVWRWIWLISIAVFAGGELILAGSFFLLPFAVGALAATVVAFAEGSITVQWAAFVIVSALSAAGLIPLRKRLDRNGTQNGIGARRLIDQEAVVEVAIAAGPASSGEVRLGREMWRAVSSNQNALAIGDVVRVVDVRGTAVVVSLHSPLQHTEGSTP
jgi:membrane protein implicated in regulation of membrane protease activity